MKLRFSIRELLWLTLLVAHDERVKACRREDVKT
jgi:hypothetical protein